MELKIGILCLSWLTVLQTSHAVQMTSGSFNSVECLQFSKDGDCKFYAQCLERRLQCLETGYALSLGQKLCMKLEELKKDFTAKGQAWSQRFRSCLMTKLFTELYSPKLTCKTVSEIAAHSHAKCLLDGPENFCHIASENTVKNAGTLLEVIKTAGLVLRAKNYGVRQVWEIAVRCNITIDMAFIKDKVIDIRKIDLPKVTGLTLPSDCRGYGNNGDLKFFECLGDLLPFEKMEEGNLLSDFFLPFSININRQLGIFNGVGKKWVGDFIKGLTNEVLRIFDRNEDDILATLPIDLFNKTMEIMIEKGFCLILRKNEWALDRGLYLGGYPYIKPRRMLHRPLADRPFDLRTRFFQDLATFRGALSRVLEYCYNLGQSKCKTFYNSVQSQKLGQRIFLRCGDSDSNSQRLGVATARSPRSTPGGLKCANPPPGETTTLAPEVDNSTYKESCGKELGCDSLTFVDRSEWVARNAVSQTSLNVPVSMVIVHHTGGPSCNSETTCKQVVKQLQADNMDTDARQDVVYNFLISPDGTVYEGRGWDVQGEHTPGWNCKSIGIAFIGNYTIVQASQAALTALDNLILCGLSREKLSKEYSVHAARELLYRHCAHSSPGEALYHQVTDVQNYAEKPSKQPCEPELGCSAYQTVDRAGWGAEPPTGTTPFSPQNTPPPLISVCHTDGNSCDNQNDCISRVKSIQNYHMNSADHSWSDIGYNFLVGGDGVVYEGRGWDVVGAHSYPSNGNSLGIAVIGNYMNNLPSNRSMDTLDQLIACGVSLGKIPAGYNLLGARDLSQTLSPGDIFYSKHVKCMDHYGQP